MRNKWQSSSLSLVECLSCPRADPQPTLNDGVPSLAYRSIGTPWSHSWLYEKPMQITCLEKVLGETQKEAVHLFGARGSHPQTTVQTSEMKTAVCTLDGDWSDSEDLQRAAPWRIRHGSFDLFANSGGRRSVTATQHSRRAQTANTR